MPSDYPIDAEVRSVPEYKWNIGASQMGNAMALVRWLQSRDQTVHRVSDAGDIISFAAERKKFLMNNFTVSELQDAVEKNHLSIPSTSSKKELVDAIVEAEQRKQCGL